MGMQLAGHIQPASGVRTHPCWKSSLSVWLLRSAVVRGALLGCANPRIRSDRMPPPLNGDSLPGSGWIYMFRGCPPCRRYQWPPLCYNVGNRKGLDVVKLQVPILSKTPTGCIAKENLRHTISKHLVSSILFWSIFLSCFSVRSVTSCLELLLTR